MCLVRVLSALERVWEVPVPVHLVQLLIDGGLMAGARHFRTRGILVEAVQFGGATTDAMAIEDWMGGRAYVAPAIGTRDLRPMPIPTVEGQATAQPGDWVVKGPAGHFYPVKPDLFSCTFEPVHDAS